MLLLGSLTVSGSYHVVSHDSPSTYNEDSGFPYRVWLGQDTHYSTLTLWVLVCMSHWLVGGSGEGSLTVPSSAGQWLCISSLRAVATFRRPVQSARIALRNLGLITWAYSKTLAKLHTTCGFSNQSPGMGSAWTLWGRKFFPGLGHLTPCCVEQRRSATW